MESYPSSTLISGPLSAPAQAVMAALRAQYAGRIHRTSHMDSFSGKIKLSQNQDHHSKASDLHTQINIPQHRPYLSSSSHVERPVRFNHFTSMMKPSNYTHPQTKLVHEEKETQYFYHSSEFLSQPDIPPVMPEGDTFKQRRTDNKWKLGDYADDGGLLTLKAGNKITVSRSNVPVMESFPSRGNSQDALAERENSTRKKIRLTCHTDDASEEERMSHLKRWSFGYLQRPSITLKDFEEESVEIGNQNKDGGSGPMEVWSIEQRERTEPALMMSNQELQNLETSQKVQNPSNEFWSKVINKETMLMDITEKPKTEPVKVSLDLTSFSLDVQLCIPSEKILQDPLQKMLSLPAASQEDSGFDPDTLHREGGSIDAMNEKEKEETGSYQENTCHHTDLAMPQSDERNNQSEVEVSNTQLENSAAHVIRETPPSHQDLSQIIIVKVDQKRSGVKSVNKPVLLQNKTSGRWRPPPPSQEAPKITAASPIQQSSSSSGTKATPAHKPQQRKATKQFLNPLSDVQCLNKRPVQTQKRQKRSELQSDKPKASTQKCSAPEMKSQAHLEGDKEGEVTSTSKLTSDPRVCDASRLSQEERVCVLEEAGKARALVVTMVYQDGTTQLDPEQKPPPAVCGLLVLLKKSLESLDVVQTEGDEEKVLFLKLEQRPFWAQQHLQHNQDLFTREMLLLMVSGTQSLVCYKAKDLLRTALRHFSKDLSWKQVAGCQVLDPQIAAWLLNPADSASCFQDLLNKHCTRPTTHTSTQPAPGHSKVTQAIASLSHLHRLMVELQNKLQSRSLWQLYFCMEQKMIPILAAMESHRIHVDKEALKKTSKLLGSKIKQLEQEAHQAAGQQFLVSSSAQLRLVLFEKLRLHEHCENKKLPRTFLKQQQSTSEAALLQLQTLHPLPKIILEYRQVHKIKSTFVDGILSCVTKSFISSTWNQTSTVSGRLSSKHPNFQALPKQPVQISRTQFVEGKEAELVIVHPRTMFIPREGWTFLSADFCQVELRLLAHLSSDPELLRIFQNPEADVFTMLASQWKGVSEDSVTSEDREHAKRIVYTIVYGAGKERLSGILGVSGEEARCFQDTFLQTYRQVQAFIQLTVQHCHQHGYVKSIMGRRRSLPHVHSPDWGLRNQAERQAVNFVVQGSAADLCKMAMIQICSHVSSSSSLTARLVAQIHDELLFEVEDSQVEEFAVLVKKTMESLQHIDSLGVNLTVPLKVCVSRGRSWGSMCELNIPPSLSPSLPPSLSPSASHTSP